MKDPYVPIISLANFDLLELDTKKQISDRIDHALQQSGFFVISDHGVCQEAIIAARKAALAYFDLPIDHKSMHESRVAGSPRGYIPYGIETLSKTDGSYSLPDIKEGYGMGPERTDILSTESDQTSERYSPNIWPEHPAGFKAAMQTYYVEMEALTLKLMELFAIGMHLEPSFFTDKFTHHNSTLRLLHYPAQDKPPQPGQLRAGSHTDYGALTILLTEDKPGGLQVRLPNGLWQDVAAPQDTFVVNIGDLMMSWSNDRWLSNFHRVANPPVNVGANARRLSIAYFCNPQDDLLIECLPTCCSEDNPAKYPPIRAGEHRAKKIRLSKGLA